MIKRICCIISIVIILGIFLSPVISIRSYAEDQQTYIPQAFSGYNYFGIYEIKEYGYLLIWSDKNNGIDISQGAILGGRNRNANTYSKLYNTYESALLALSSGDNENFTYKNSGTIIFEVNNSLYQVNDVVILLRYTNFTDTYYSVGIRNNYFVAGNTTIKNNMINIYGTIFIELPVLSFYTYTINNFHCTSSIQSGSISGGEDLTITFTPDNGYSFYGLSNVFQVSPANAFSSTTIDYPTYYGEGITITFHNITSSFTISINAAEYFTISYDLQNITVSNQTSAILAGQTYITTVAIEDENYDITYAEISMGGIDITNQSWDPETNTITAFSVNGNIAIVIYAELNEQGQLSNIQLKLQSIISILLGQSDLQQQEIDLLGDIKDMLDNPDPDDDIDSTDEQSRIQEEISNYDDLETSLSDQAASNVDEVMDTSIDENVVQFMIEYQQGMSWLYDNELVVAGLGSCGIFMVIGFLIFGKKGHG